MALAEYADSIGCKERDCWRERGGALPKVQLVETILEKQRAARMDYQRLNNIDLALAIARGDAEAIAECDARAADAGFGNMTAWTEHAKDLKAKGKSDSEIRKALEARYQLTGSRIDRILELIRGDEEKKPGAPPYEHKYNKEAVQQAINKDKRIKPGEASAIHRLLKGRHDTDASYSAKDMGDGEFLVRRKKDGAQLEVKASSEENAIYKAKQASTSAWG